MINISINLPPEIVEWASKKAKKLGIGRSTFLKLTLIEAYEKSAKKIKVSKILNEENE